MMTAKTDNPQPRPIAVEIDIAQPPTWADVFGNDRPVELEIGTGKAGYLLRRAHQHPEANFFGIEWANKFYKYAVDRMQRWGMTNVRMCRTDASRFVRLACPRESLSVLHVYHPDPWPKKRHHKRRLIQRPFVDAAIACLIPGGQWRIQTDHAEYFEQIQALLRNHPALEEIDFDDPAFGVTDGVVETNFEIKYAREGRTFYNIAVRRKQ